uniref:Uncharacterized protein n=1 Tax=Anas zonorhyncha TaxID=75864 RepID=A0A8B9ZU24_9AVES
MLACCKENVERIQKRLEEFLNFKQLKTSLKEDIFLDYYTARLWILLNFLLENFHDKYMTVGDKIKDLGKAMAGIGETDSERSGDMDVFSTEQAKAITDYLSISLFKPYKLYEHLFHSPRELVITANARRSLRTEKLKTEEALRTEKLKSPK